MSGLSGRCFERAAEITLTLLFVLAMLSIVGWLGDALFGWDGRDATDGADGTRSGLSLYTDHGTGCQYLVTFPVFGAITPRLDAAGQPICGRAGGAE